MFSKQTIAEIWRSTDQLITEFLDQFPKELRPWLHDILISKDAILALRMRKSIYVISLRIREITTAIKKIIDSDDSRGLYVNKTPKAIKLTSWNKNLSDNLQRFQSIHSHISITLLSNAINNSQNNDRIISEDILAEYLSAIKTLSVELAKMTKEELESNMIRFSSSNATDTSRNHCDELIGVDNPMLSNIAITCENDILKVIEIFGIVEKPLIFHSNLSRCCRGS